jgi:hypothetical protein
LTSTFTEKRFVLKNTVSNILCNLLSDLPIHFWIRKCTSWKIRSFGCDNNKVTYTPKKIQSFSNYSFLFLIKWSKQKVNHTFRKRKIKIPLRVATWFLWGRYDDDTSNSGFLNSSTLQTNRDKQTQSKQCQISLLYQSKNFKIQGSIYRNEWVWLLWLPWTNETEAVPKFILSGNEIFNENAPYSLNFNSPFVIITWVWENKRDQSKKK